MRNNIFNLISCEEISLKKEYNRLYTLFEKTSLQYEHNMLACIESHFFNWKYRNRYLSAYELMKDLKINHLNMETEINLEKLLLYMEFIVNTILIIESDLKFEDRDIMIVLIKNCTNILEQLNYEFKKNGEGQIIIVEKNALTTAVAEIDSTIASEVIEYRRFSLKGNTKEKAEILKKLSNKIEGLKLKFKGTTYNKIIEDTDFLLNNLNIRHNNLEGPKKKEYTKNMPKDELEDWYDTIYDMMLTVIMINDYMNKNKKIVDLKTKY